MSKNNYTLLIEKLDQFTRKFYINKIIRGVLYTIALVIALFLLFNLLESQFYFSQGVRKLQFFSFLGISLAALAFWVLNPMLKYFNLGKTISNQQAAQIIGQHFEDVQDKLLNILQLNDQASGASDRSLIDASINQKSQEIKPVPFKKAIDLGQNRKYLKYAMPPFLLLLVLLFAAPSLITESTHRIINNNEDFERAAPFSFSLDVQNLEVIQYQDKVITVSVDGETLPNEVFIRQGDFNYRMDQISPSIYSYTFRNVQKDLNFEVFSGRVNSPEYSIDVIEKPNLADLQVFLDYPNYLGRKNEAISNIGDLTIPQGTNVTWDFQAEHTDDVSIRFSNQSKKVTVERKSEIGFNLKKRFMSDVRYKVFLANDRIPTPDSISYSISVIPDKRPTINVEQFQDSITSNLFYFLGSASDDYGISSLSFIYQRSNERGQQSPPQVIKLKDKSPRELQYSHTFDINELALKPGENVSFYFEVFDNDGVNGFKSAKTNTLSFKKPTIEEFEEKEDANEEEIKDKLLEAKKNAEKIQEEFKKMREDLLQEKEMDWQDKKNLEKLLDEQKELQKQLEKAKEKFDENLKNQEEFSEQEEEILEKQEKLEEMFEEVLNDETKELMEKIEELMQELNKDNALEMMEQMEMTDDQLEKNLDRLLELYKQLEMEKEVKEQVEKLEELAKKQEELAEETEKEEKPKEELEKEQEKLNEEFEELKEKQEELEKQNEELSPPKDLGDDSEEKMEEISEEMEQSKEELESGENQKASDSQKKASQKMKDMAGNLQSSMQSGEEEQMEEDIKALRQLLENLVSLSFEQEDLVDELDETQTNIPRYVDLVQTQFKIKDDFRLIEDSLQALSLRVSQIESFVTEKVAETKFSIKESLEQLEERKKPAAIKNQRETMTSVNDLALMLSESLDQMQQQMGSMMSGSQMCNKPGGKGQKSGKSGKVPMDKITKGQEGMQESLDALKKKMEGKGGKGGQGGKNGKEGMAKEFAQAAARQAALRQALQELQKEKQEQGKGSRELQEIIDGMDKTEIDLVNKRLDNDVMKRQQDILTKLLKAEKAERQREFDNKRKAEVGQNQKRTLPPALQDYLKQREAEIDLYKTVSPELRPYYKTLVDRYYDQLKKQ